MFKVLRSEDRIKLVGAPPPSLPLQSAMFRLSGADVSSGSLQAVRLESGWSERVRYMVVIYTSGHQDTEENIVLGMDFSDKDR